MLRDTLKTYYTLAKPGIIYGNAITAIGGFFLASRGHLPIWLFIAMLVGISLVIGSACVFNNYYDREIDKLMARTKKRALAQGVVAAKHAILYGWVLGIAGTLLLAWGTNTLTATIGLFGLLVYVYPYTFGKRKSVHGTLIGSVAGAVPVVVGYTAVVNRLDAGALIIFLALVLWQMPHFYGIAMYRVNDYKAASIPVLSLVKGMRATKIQTLLYVAAFTLVASLLTVYHYTGYIYLILMLILGLAWLGMGLRSFKTKADGPWGRSMFFFSLVIITVFSGMIAVGPLLP